MVKRIINRLKEIGEGIHSAVYEYGFTRWGIRVYRKEKENIYILRRNVHRIEKGLTVKDRRPVFALGYIRETVAILASLRRSSRISGGDYQWTVHTLKIFFSSAGAHPVIDESRNLFEQMLKEFPEESAKEPEKLRSLAEYRIRTAVSSEGFTALLKSRKSVRYFQEKEVETSLLDDAFRICGLAPTACNRQPYRFLVLRDRDLIRRVGTITYGADSFIDNIPCLILVLGDFSAFFSVRDRHVPYIDGSFAALNLIHGLELRGLNSCVINWPDYARFHRKAAGLGLYRSYERILMLMAVGYGAPDAEVPDSTKKDLKDLREYK